MDGAINPTALHVTAAASLGGVIFWVLGFDAMGAALGSAGKALFNWHPVLMTAAFGVLVAESVLAFRSSRIDRPVRKSLHGVMHTVAVVLAAVGLWAVLRFHKEIGAPDFYSVHSYVGLLALSLLALQYAFGVACYWLHLPSPTLKAAFMPSHRALGKLVYLCGVAALVSGLMQKQSFLRSPTDAYSRVTVFANCLALLFLLTAGAVLFGLEPKAPPAAALLQHEVNAEGLGDALGGGGRKEPNGRKDSEA